LLAWNERQYQRLTNIINGETENCVQKANNLLSQGLPIDLIHLNHHINKIKTRATYANLQYLRTWWWCSHECQTTYIIEPKDSKKFLLIQIFEMH